MAGRVNADALADDLGPQRVADQREDEGLREAHDSEKDIPIAGGMHRAIGTDHTEAELIGRDAGERGIDVGDRSLGVVSEALVG
jgi:hypothetical protein